MPKYTVTRDQFAHGHYTDGDEIDGVSHRVWAHTQHKKGDEVELTEKDAERHIADGTVAKPKDVEPEQDSKARDDVGNDTSAPPAKK